MQHEVVAKGQMKIGVRPPTKQKVAAVAKVMGWTESLTADRAIDALIKHKRIRLPRKLVTPATTATMTNSLGVAN
jgi:hypothetical protein